MCDEQRNFVLVRVTSDDEYMSDSYKSKRYWIVEKDKTTPTEGGDQNHEQQGDFD